MGHKNQLGFYSIIGRFNGVTKKAQFLNINTKKLGFLILEFLNVVNPYFPDATLNDWISFFVSHLSCKMGFFLPLNLQQLWSCKYIDKNEKLW
ncbi:hypothetical protein CON69_20170 [Bacillus pseudomycoides]|nr:hypothetical protein CON69_20170 [Bacillus pseudomycoides]